MFIAQSSAQRLWLLTFVKWHFSCLSPQEFSCQNSVTQDFSCCQCLKVARSFQLLSLKIPLAFFLFTLVKIRGFQSISVEWKIHYKKQAKLVVFFLVGRGKFYCVFIKSQKKATLNTVKLLTSFCIFKPVSNCSRLEWEHSRFCWSSWKTRILMPDMTSLYLHAWHLQVLFLFVLP